MRLTSFIVPVHNRASELPQTLESLLAQRSGEWEAILVDDHSTDNAPYIARDFAEMDVRFRVLSLPDDRRGAPAARNYGLAHARGEFVVFLDSDDLVAPTCVEQRSDYMRAHPELDFAIWRCQLFRDRPGDVPFLWNADTGEDDLDRLLRMDVPWQTTSPIWRRESLRKVEGPWDESVLSGQDWEFHLRAVASGLNYARVDQVDCFWRIATGSRESIGKTSFGKEHARARPAAIRKIYDFLNAKGLMNDARRRAFAALYFGAAENVAYRVSRREGRAVWRETFDLGLVSRAQLKQGDRYFFARRWPALGERRRQELERAWPAGALPRRGKFFNIAPIDPARPPAVSVVMSAYNNADFIRASVESVLIQTFRDFEFIIIDDGSTDGTGELLQRYADGDCRIRLVRRDNKGLTVSLNEGLALARGTFIARMDGDDVAHPERFEKELAYLQQHDDCVIVGSKVMLIDPCGVELGEAQFFVGHEAIEHALVQGRGDGLCHPSVMMRRSSVERVGPYKPELNGAEDLELFLRLAEIGRLHNLPDILLSYRKHPASVNHTKHAHQAKLVEGIVAQARRKRGLPPLASESVARWQPVPVPVQLRNWGWNALRRKRPDATMQHAWRAMKAQPLNVEGWKLMFCAVRGR